MRPSRFPRVNDVMLAEAMRQILPLAATGMMAPALMAAAPSLIIHPAILSAGRKDVVIDIPQNAHSLSATVWDRFGNRVELLSERMPSPGLRTIRWTPGHPVATHLLGNTGVLRVAVDDFVESRLVALGHVEA
jgi:hypothetical protein